MLNRYLIKLDVGLKSLPAEGEGKREDKDDSSILSQQVFTLLLFSCTLLEVDK